MCMQELNQASAAQVPLQLHAGGDSCCRAGRSQAPLPQAGYHAEEQLWGQQIHIVVCGQFDTNAKHVDKVITWMPSSSIPIKTCMAHQCFLCFPCRV